ncbi:MAG: energy-coupling factor ABC transporter permease [Lachnospiraceae bacterium]|nr:energy-coupling factor ABC transporter permease [Lachnospiraceae bacterium]
MHMADALVSPAVGLVMYGATAAAAGYSIYKVRLEENTKKVPMMAVMSAFVFATQMLNFTIPGTGSSGHLCGGFLLSAILGPYAGFLSMIVILLTQCLLFADGGLLALGANVWNMAFYGCFLGYFCIYRPMMKKGFSNVKLGISSILACVITLQFGAFSVVLETLLSGITDLPFGTFVAAMQPIHLAIGLVEGLISAAVLIFIYNTRPELLTNDEMKTNKEFSMKKLLVILSIAVVVCAGGISLVASSNPDGLEWSMEQVAGSTELEDSGDSAYATAANIQDTTALLPDYAFKDSDSAVGTSFSGILGAAIVAGLCLVICLAFGFFRHKKKKA